MSYEMIVNFEPFDKDSKVFGTCDEIIKRLKIFENLVSKSLAKKAFQRNLIEIEKNISIKEKQHMLLLLNQDGFFLKGREILKRKKEIFKEAKISNFSNSKFDKMLPEFIKSESEKIKLLLSEIKKIDKGWIVSTKQKIFNADRYRLTQKGWEEFKDQPLEEIGFFNV